MISASTPLGNRNSNNPNTIQQQGVASPNPQIPPSSTNSPILPQQQQQQQSQSQPRRPSISPMNAALFASITQQQQHFSNPHTFNNQQLFGQMNNNFNTNAQDYYPTAAGMKKSEQLGNENSTDQTNNNNTSGEKTENSTDSKNESGSRSSKFFSIFSFIGSLFSKLSSKKTPASNKNTSNRPNVVINTSKVRCFSDMTMQQALKDLSLSYQFFSALVVVLVMALAPQNSFIGVLLGALHVTFGMEALWPPVYREHLENITLHERLAFAAYAVCLTFVALLIWKLFSSTKLTKDLSSMKQLVVQHEIERGGVDSRFVFVAVFLPALVEAALAVRGNMEDVFADMDFQQQQQQNIQNISSSSSTNGNLASSSSSSLRSTAAGHAVLQLHSHWRLQAMAMLWILDYWKQVVVIPAIFTLCWRLVRDVSHKRVASQRWNLVSFCAWRCIIEFVLFPQRFFSWVGYSSFAWYLFVIGTVNYCLASVGNSITVNNNTAVSNNNENINNNNNNNENNNTENSPTTAAAAAVISQQQQQVLPPEFQLAPSVRDSVHLTIAATIRSAIVVPFFCLGVLTVLAGVHVVELLGLWLVVFLIFVWIPAAIRTFSIDVLALQCVIGASVLLLWLSELLTENQQENKNDNNNQNQKNSLSSSLLGQLTTSEQLQAVFGVAFALFSIALALSSWIVIIFSLQWWRRRFPFFSSRKFKVAFLLFLVLIVLWWMNVFPSFSATTMISSSWNWFSSFISDPSSLTSSSSTDVVVASSSSNNNNNNINEVVETTKMTTNNTNNATTTTLHNTNPHLDASQKDTVTSFLKPLLLGTDNFTASIVYHPSVEGLPRVALSWLFAETDYFSFSFYSSSSSSTTTTSESSSNNNDNNNANINNNNNKDSQQPQFKFLSLRWIATSFSFYFFILAIFFGQWLMKPKQQQQQQISQDQNPSSSSSAAAAAATVENKESTTTTKTNTQYKTENEHDVNTTSTENKNSNEQEISATQQQQQQQQKKKKSFNFLRRYFSGLWVYDSTLLVLKYSCVVDRVSRAVVLVTLSALCYILSHYCGKFAASSGPIRWSSHFFVFAFALGVAMDLVEKITLVIAKCWGSTTSAASSSTTSNVSTNNVNNSNATTNNNNLSPSNFDTLSLSAATTTGGGGGGMEKSMFGGSTSFISPTMSQQQQHNNQNKNQPSPSFLRNRNNNNNFFGSQQQSVGNLF